MKIIKAGLGALAVIAGNAMAQSNDLLPDLPGQAVDASSKKAEIPVWLLAQAGGMQNAGQNLSSSAGGLVNSTMQSWLQNLLATDRGVAEVSLSGIEKNKPLYSILVVRPLTETPTTNTFFQGSIFTQGDHRTTANLGFGYRQLAGNNKVLLGGNAFYDQEFPYNHQRMSLGGEVRTSVAEINANWYNGLSGWVNIGESLEEKSLGGHNIELAVALPYLPSTYLRTNSFRWNGMDGSASLTGIKNSIGSHLFGGLQLEAGFTRYNNLPGAHFAMLTYTFGGDYKKSVRFFQSEAYKLEDMTGRRHEKIRRENRIIKATRSTTTGAFTVTVSGS